MYHVPKADTYSPKYGGCQDHAPIGRCALKVSPVAGLTGFPLVSRRQRVYTSVVVMGLYKYNTKSVKRPQ